MNISVALPADTLLYVPVRREVGRGYVRLRVPRWSPKEGSGDGVLVWLSIDELASVVGRFQDYLANPEPTPHRASLIVDEVLDIPVMESDGNTEPQLLFADVLFPLWKLEPEAVPIIVSRRSIPGLSDIIRRNIGEDDR